MANNIVTVNVSTQVAPTPSTLQSSGALISVGGTTLTPGTFQFLTQVADLTALQGAAVNLASLAWSATGGGTVTGTTGTAIGLAIGDQFPITIVGVVPAAYNGTFMATVTAARSFTYQLVSNPGAVTTLGTYTPPGVAELLSMADTFFGQGTSQGVYVLELGLSEASAAVATLQNFINTNSPQVFYSYLVPRAWDGVAAFLAMIALFESNTSKTYFFVTTSLQNYALYTALMKCVFAEVESPPLNVVAANVITSMTWLGGQVTATTTTAHGVTPGTYFQITGVSPAGYNGWFLALGGTTGSTLVYALATNPTAVTVQGLLAANLYVNAGVPLGTEFSLAAAFNVTLSYSPSTTNRVTPLSFAFLFGVTPFPTRGFASLLSTLKAANINYVGAGSEGGISNTILFWGNTLDGNQFNYWYSVDWVQINIDLSIANAVINGSNNPANPLYYNQDGINQLQHVAASVLANAIAFGMAIGTVTQTALNGIQLGQQLDAGAFANQAVVNAVPFLTYTQAIPGDYKIGRYAGFTAIYIPARGFEAIVFNLIVSQFVAL